MDKNTTLFQKALQHTLGIEGGYSDHKNDPGGKTMLGITQAVALRHGYAGAMQDMPQSLAITIYHIDYWQAMQLDSIGAIAQQLAIEMFDTAVNMGVHYPQIWLQEGLNAFNHRGRDWPDILEDGRVGMQTIRALKAFYASRGTEGIKVMLAWLNAQQGSRYAYLARRNEQLEDFVYGWFKHRVLI